MSNDKVIELIKSNQEEEVKPDSILDIVFKDGNISSHEVDFFGVSEELPGFIVLWKDDVESPVAFYNHDTIKKLSIREITIEPKINNAGFKEVESD